MTCLRFGEHRHVVDTGFAQNHTVMQWREFGKQNALLVAELLMGTHKIIYVYIYIYIYIYISSSSLPVGATARGGPWPPLQYASRSLGSLLCLSIRLYPYFSGPWTRHPAISFLVFLFVMLHTAFRTASFLGLLCLAFFLYAKAILFFGI